MFFEIPQFEKKESEMKSSTVHKSDYELYAFTVPLGYVGKKRKSFITRELEKNHPGFSDSCCFDSKVRLRKGKIQSLVTVMNKVRLQEYKKKSKGSLSLEGIKGMKVFGNKKVSILTLAVLLFVSSVLLLSYLFRSTENLPALDNEAQFNVKEVEKKNNLLTADEILNPLFENLSDKKSRISMFSFKVEKDPGESKACLNLLLNNIFPEDIVGFADVSEVKESIGAVSYDSRKSRFLYTLDFPVYDSDETSLRMNESQLKEVRSLINSFGIIEFENQQSGDYKCTISKENISDFFSSMNNFLSKEKLELTLCNIVRNDNGLQCDLTLSESAAGNNIFTILKDKCNLFYDERERKLPVEKVRSSKAIAPEKVISETTGEKIGSILTKDGRHITYYRGQDGRVKGVEE